MAEQTRGVISGEDGRLKKSSAPAARDSRDTADESRTGQDGTALTISERRKMLREQMGQEILPTPPQVAGWHFCWLSTTNSADPIYKRVRLGYEPVKAHEIPGFTTQHQINGGDFDGCVACNEMILFKIPEELYQEIMLINHHEKPLEEEESIRAAATSDEVDSDGKRLIETSGFSNLGRRVRTPTF